MARNANLGAAKRAKNDEFYTRWEDIEAEMNAYWAYDHDVFRNKVVLLPCDDPEWSEFTRYFAANFDFFGMRKLISTSYAKGAGNRCTTDFERNGAAYDPAKHETHGKVFTLERGHGPVDIDDLKWEYLDGDGDFRSDEVTRLRDEADVVVTNPPFSLARSFVAWLMESGKQFIIIGNQNMITYKEIFPLLKDNRMWLGTTHPKKFKVVAQRDDRDNYDVDETGMTLAMFGNVCWFTNVEHGRRHERLMLDTMANNLRFNKKLRRKLESSYGKIEYPRYDNYDAIEVPFTECIPSDYDAGMGVPITFLDKWNPEQFEIVGADFELAEPEPLPDGKTGTGRFYVRERESTAFVLALGHSEEEVTAALVSMGVSVEDMRWCSGIMGVPITFLDKHNPEQFEIVWQASGNTRVCAPDDVLSFLKYKQHAEDRGGCGVVHGTRCYSRILIRPKH